MATIGLRDLYKALVTEGTDDAPDAYGTPSRVAKMISVDLSVEVAEATLYADDGADEVEREFANGTLKINVNDLSPEELAELLGQETDEDGVAYASDSDVAPYWAIGFRARKPGGKYKYIWLYKVKFAVPSEKYQTKTNSIEYSTPEIEGTIIKRPDGLWKADCVAAPEDEVAKNWFTKVREKAAA